MNAPKNLSEKVNRNLPRELRHGLTYDKKTDRWSCLCGYKLGDGHHALYAICPLSHRDKAVNQKRDEESLSSNADKLPIKQTALDIFDLAQTKEEEKPHATTTNTKPVKNVRADRRRKSQRDPLA